MRFALWMTLALALLASPAAALPPISTPLTGLTITANTGEKPQSKVWTHDGRWWCVVPNSSGTWIWRLDGTTWTSIYQLSTSTSAKVDVKSAGNVVHVLLYQGTSSALASAEYVPVGQTYQAWAVRPANVAITLDSGVETATIDIDSQGRMWLASDEIDEIMVRYSDSPYSSWSAPISLVTGTHSDDVSVVTALPNGTVGVLWSNQVTQRFGFRVHVDGDSPAAWSADEVPASQSALAVGLGMADDHLNVAVAADATLYAAVKTSYDTGGFVKIALLVRRPAGTWDNLYEISETGTRGICLLDENAGTVTVIYTSTEGSGNILYKESPTSAIVIPASPSTLISGSLNEVSSTKQNINGSIVILASTTSGGLQAVGVLRTGNDLSPPSVTVTAPNGGEVWTAGSAQNITWTASDDVGVTAIDLEYSTDGGTVWNPIASSLAHTGTYSWSVANAPTTQARVRATAHDAATNQSQDASDANFTIQAGPITHTITATAGLNGMIAPPGAVLVSDGADQTFVITPDAGYQVADVLVDGNSVGAVTGYTFMNVVMDHTIAASFAVLPGPGNLVGWWPMEEGSGPTVQDVSGLGNHGTLANGAAWTPGVAGLALAVNGTNQFAVAPSNASLDMTTAITMAAWIKPGRVATQDLFKKAIFGGTNGYELTLSSSGSSWPQKIFMRFNEQSNGDTYRVNSTTLYPIDGNTWIHAAATFDGTTMRLYVNGVLEGSLAMPIPIGTNATPLAIGGQSDGARPYLGALDDVRLYDGALSGAEIVAIMGHTITASAGAGGSITPNGPAPVHDGAAQSFTITPDACFTIADVLVDGNSVGPVADYTFTDVTANHTIAASFALQSFTIAASAGPGGDVSPSGNVAVDCGSDQSFTITPDAGYAVADVLVDGNSVGLVTNYPFTNVQANHTLEASFASISADQVAAVPTGGSAISTATPCITVPVVYTRTDATPALGYSVTIELSSNLSLCGSEFVSAGYTLAPRQFAVTPLGGNQWTVDDVTLGTPCGATGSGTLFTLDVTSAQTSGTGTITVLAVQVRDCFNLAVPAQPGAPATITIDGEGPAQTTDLVAIPIKMGNHVPLPSPPRATTPVRLDFTVPPDAASVEVYRKAFGGYPQYDENGGAVPAPPPVLPGGGWTLTAVTASGQTDEPLARDFWYYALVTRDAYGNPSLVSNRTSGTLNYYLGDVSTGLAACAGDDLVDLSDLSLLGFNYGAVLPVNDPLECLDVGPTTDFSPDGRPTTDNVIEFEDLIMFALNYNVVSAPQFATTGDQGGSSAGSLERLTLAAPERVTAGTTFDVRVLLSAGGRIHGLSVALGWDRAVVEPVDVQSGGMFESAGGVAHAAGNAAMDGVLLGASRPGLAGEGTFAIVRFRALRDGEPTIRIARVRARDSENQSLALEDLRPGQPSVVTGETRFLPAMPAPFTTRTTLAYHLAVEGDVELVVFGIEGRRVRTLYRGRQPAGTYQVTWDGADDRGSAVAAGVYYARLSVEQRRIGQKLVRLAR